MNPIVTGLRRQICDAQEALSAFQKDCPHTDLVFESKRSNIGDYDEPGTGRIYWREYHCAECGFPITTTQVKGELEERDR